VGWPESQYSVKRLLLAPTWTSHLALYRLCPRCRASTFFQIPRSRKTSKHLWDPINSPGLKPSNKRRSTSQSTRRNASRAMMTQLTTAAANSIVKSSCKWTMRSYKKPQLSTSNPPTAAMAAIRVRAASISFTHARRWRLKHNNLK
jgi:hypothetical protein